MLESVRSRLLLLITLASVTLAVGLWQSRPPPAADAESCTVYRAFFDDFPERTNLFFNPQSDPDLGKIRASTAPKHFERDTGDLEEVTIGNDSFKRPVREKFVVDTSGYFDPVASHSPRRLAGCFNDHNQQPEFYTGSFSDLYDREGDPQRDGDGAVTSITMVWVSPVGFSEDGNKALIYTEHTCGWLCGAGYFLLFERAGDEWKRTGDSWRWIS